MPTVEEALAEDVKKYILEEQFSAMDIREVRRLISCYNYSPEMKQKIIDITYSLQLAIKIQGGRDGEVDIKSSL